MKLQTNMRNADFWRHNVAVWGCIFSGLATMSYMNIEWGKTLVTITVCCHIRYILEYIYISALLLPNNVDSCHFYLFENRATVLRYILLHFKIFGFIYLVAMVTHFEFTSLFD